jgi:DNA-binding LacI/PurR family transcriptional regulator
VAAVTLREVAAAAGVSVGTASNAFSRPDLVSAQARERVHAAARKLNYGGPNPAARRLRTGEAGALGLIFTEDLEYAFGDDAALQFLAGVADALRDRGAGLLMVPLSSKQEEATRLVREALVAAFVVYSCANGDPRVAAAVQRRLPVVIVDQPQDTPRVPFVGIDDRAAARSAAEHVRALGHERVAIVSFATTSPDIGDRVFPLTTERRAGYHDGLGDIEPELVVCRPNSHEAAEEAGRALLHRDPADRPTALLCMSDAIALGCRRVAAALDIDVPRQLSIVGFDDSPVALLSDPPLTTVAQPMAEKGRVATERSLAAAAGRKRLPRRTIMPTELVVRGTTAAPPRTRRRRS